MNVTRNFVLVMAMAGALAGLAGSSQVLGVDHWVGQGFSAGYGFDAIALALLGKSHPLGVVLSALLSASCGAAPLACNPWLASQLNITPSSRAWL